MKSDLRELMDGYIVAAQWSSTGEREGGPKDEFGEGTPEEMDTVELAAGEEFKLGIRVARWARKHWAVLERAAVALEHGQWTGWELVGHNAWLDAVGSGVGFWDRSALEGNGFGAYLSKLAGDGDLPGDCSYCCWIDAEGEGRFELC